MSLRDDVEAARVKAEVKKCKACRTIAELSAEDLAEYDTLRKDKSVVIRHLAIGLGLGQDSLYLHLEGEHDETRR